MDELRIVLNADEQLRVDMQDETPLTLNLQNPEIRTVTNNYNDLDNKPQINGVTLVGNKSNTDLDLVNRTGDTMTGDLYIRNGHCLNVVSPEIDVTTTPSASKSQDSLIHLDKNNTPFGFVNGYQHTDGNIGFQVVAARPYNGGYALNGIVLEVASDGTYEVGVSAPMQWRKALNGQEIKVRSGTVVITPSSNSTSETVITSAQLATMFGISGSSPSNTTVMMSNGDYVANAVGVSSIYNSNVAGWKALFSEPISTPIRINWIAVYFGL